MIVFLIIWLLCGIIAVWREYHGTLKTWYEDSNESYWDYHKREGSSGIMMLLWMTPLFILCGTCSLIIVELYSENNCWWFTTKNK